MSGYKLGGFYSKKKYNLTQKVRPNATNLIQQRIYRNLEEQKKLSCYLCEI